LRRLASAMSSSIRCCLRAQDRCGDSLFNCILLRLRSSSMLLSGLELRRDDDDYGGVIWSRNVKDLCFWWWKGDDSKKLKN
jgi:hypothetical protein